METQTTITKSTTTRTKIKSLLGLQKITMDDIEDLDNPERRQLGATLTDMLNKLKGEERDDFINKIEPIMPAGSQNEFWEHNHQVINQCITNYLREYGFMPSKSAIARETGLSRQTIIKHLKDYKTNPSHAGEMEQFKFMAPKVLASVFKFACNGDTRAARLYFEMVGALNKQQPNTVVNGQTNYIQINNTILSQENLKQLSAEQLAQLENIITNNLAK